MQKIILNLLLLLTAVCGSAIADDLQVKLLPSSVLEGEPFVLQLSVDGAERPELTQLPDKDKFIYQGASQSTQIINGSRSNSVSYQFVASAPGDYEIPPLPVKLGRQQKQTPPLKLQVLKDAAGGIGSDNVFARCVLGIKRTKVYVGEDIPMAVNLYYPPKLKLQVTAYPQLDIGKSVFNDFRQINPENPHYARIRQNRQVVNDNLFEVISFPTAFRPLAPGLLEIKGSVPCRILIPDNRNRNRDPFDSFWGSASYRRIDRQLTLEKVSLQVEALPPIPDSGYFLGLVGQYHGQASLSANKVNALEPVSLNIILTGSGSMENLRAPELTLDGCRVYPGEIRQQGKNCVLSYAIIPLQAGNVALDMNFYIFDPQLEKYSAIPVKTVLQVAPQVGKSSASIPVDPAKSIPAADADSSGNVEEENLPRTTLLYCKRAPSGAVGQFYRRNRIELAILLFALAPLAWIAVCGINRYRTRKAADPDNLRRDRALEQRSVLINRIKHASSGELPQLASGPVADFLSDRWKLPPGSTLETLAEHAEDPELSAALHECAQASYLPPGMSENALSDAAKVRFALLKAVKSLILISAVAIGWPCEAAEDKTPRSWHEALQAYDQGKYPKAKAYFEKYQQENLSDPNVFYNLGCISEANNEPEMALYYLERSGLLNPLDSATHENRNVMRRKFFWPEIGSAHTPHELLLSLRDRLHPEDYLVLAACAWALFWLMLICRRRLPESWLWATGGTLLIAVLVCLAAMGSQYSSVYRQDQALVVAKNAPLYTFPGKHNGQQQGSLAGGTPVRIVEQQGDYVLVENRDREGWTAKNNIRQLIK